MYPKLEIDLKKLSENTRYISDKFKANNIKLTAVTKVFCGSKEISQVMIDNGAEILADSRIENLKRLKDLNVEKLLLRLPMISEVEDLVDYCDYSLNSEISTIREISKSALGQGKIHNISLMIDLGDLREGVLPEDVDAYVDEIIHLKGVRLSGVGVNLTCYGGVIPDEGNLGRLVEIANQIEDKYQVKLDIISGGNSSSLYLLDDKRLPKKINNLRIGEALVLGRETAYGNKIDGMHTDCFRLAAEIIEIKEKSSLPKGKIGMDAFGNTPVFEDKGQMLRAILAIGRQDVNVDAIYPMDEDIEIIGASSDHLILDMTKSKSSYKVGDIINFTMDYGGLLSLYTSNYVKKDYIK